MRLNEIHVLWPFVPLFLFFAGCDSQPPERPQDPRPPFPYQIEDVEFPSAYDGHLLHGTLTLPQGAARSNPVGAVVLITGSGQQDRDEQVAGHRPFAVIADYLTRRGWAVLRFDDRFLTDPVQGVDWDLYQISFDVEGAFDYLLGRDEINGAMIGLLGHSEGGVIAPMLAVRRSETAFVVTLAGPAVPGTEILVRQGELVLEDPEVIRRHGPYIRGLARILGGHGSTAEKEAQFLALYEELYGPQDESRRRQVVSHWRYQLSRTWMALFLTHDPAIDLERIRCPLLALYGGLDVQVDAEQNAPIVEQIVKTSDIDKAEVIVFPRKNHLFQDAESGSLQEYAQISETISPEVLATIARWLAAL